MIEKILNIFNDQRFQWVFLLTFVGLITIQRLLVPNTITDFSSFNNFLIFKQSYFHLLENQDLYKHYPLEHYDLFKYSPSFALGMGVLAYFPIWLGLFLWNFLNVFVLFFGLKKMNFSSRNGFVFTSLFIFIELITTTQNSQSNALIVGLIILAFNSLENSKVSRASWMLVSTVFIKLFGLVAFTLFLFYPKKIKSGLNIIGWTLVLTAIPLLFISYQELFCQYVSWLDLLKNDHSNELKISLMGFLNSWFGIGAYYKNYILFIGVIIFLIPLVKINSYKIERYRQLFLSSMLLWVVLFNHMAESATFILAVVGIGIWFFTKANPTKFDKFLMIMVVLFTLLAPSDIYPAYIRNTYFIPFTVKVIPCMLIWFKINFELLIVNEKLAINP
jgi:hypothetical protein